VAMVVDFFILLFFLRFFYFILRFPKKTTLTSKPKQRRTPLAREGGHTQHATNQTAASRRGRRGAQRQHATRGGPPDSWAARRGGRQACAIGAWRHHRGGWPFVVQRDEEDAGAEAQDPRGGGPHRGGPCRSASSSHCAAAWRQAREKGVFPPRGETTILLQHI
jgi:hypothetical protein